MVLSKKKRVEQVSPDQALVRLSARLTCSIPVQRAGFTLAGVPMASKAKVNRRGANITAMAPATRGLLLGEFCIVATLAGGDGGDRTYRRCFQDLQLVRTVAPVPPADVAPRTVPQPPATAQPTTAETPHGVPPRSNGTTDQTEFEQQQKGPTTDQPAPAVRTEPQVATPAPPAALPSAGEPAQPVVGFGVLGILLGLTGGMMTRLGRKA